MPYDHYLRLESRQPNDDFDRGVRAEIGDPLWFLGRQWQMGEHQGENAGSPVRLQAWITRRALDPLGGDPRWDPQRVPPEAIIESEPGDWWTIGRRIRYGMRFRDRVDVDTLWVDYFLNRPPQKSRAYGTDLPAPYERFSGDDGDRVFLDGWKVWRDRAELGIAEADFPEVPATEPADMWQPDQLVYTTEFSAEDHTLTVDRHAGGRVDWYTVDGDTPFAPRPPELDDTPGVSVFPGQLVYPGAPNARYWQIEDAAVDIGGYPPDRSHFPSMLLTDLMSSHGTEWFLFPIDTLAGNVLTVERVVVTDGFGDLWRSEEFSELRPPTDWSLFRMHTKSQGEDYNSLLVWPTAISPLTGGSLEEVILGVDEYANLLWAVERRVNSRDIRTPSDEERSQHSVVPPTRPVNDPNQTYQYRAAADAVPYWHPYKLGEYNGSRRFIQARLVDYSGEFGELMEPVPASNLLNDPRLTSPDPVHVIDPATVPVDGLVLERRWMLARDTAGQPVLWINRQRKPLLGAPARHLRFDVMERVES